MSPSASRKRPITSPTAPLARRRACSSSSTKPDARCGLSGAGIPSPKTAAGADRAASIVSRIAGSFISASRRSVVPTIAGAARPRNDAPEVAANRSRISLARVGWSERQAAPLSWTISSAWVQPIGRRRATASMVRPQETAIVPVGRSLARRSTATSATASRARSSASWPAMAAGTSATTAATSPNRATSASSRSTSRAAGWTTSIRTMDSSQRAVQQPAHLEPAQAQPVPDLLLAEVHAVVHLRDPHHQPDIARTPTPDCEHRLSADCTYEQNGAHVCSAG